MVRGLFRRASKKPCWPCWKVTVFLTAANIEQVLLG